MQSLTRWAIAGAAAVFVACAPEPLECPDPIPDPAFDAAVTRAIEEGKFFPEGAFDGEDTAWFYQNFLEFIGETSLLTPFSGERYRLYLSDAHVSVAVVIGLEIRSDRAFLRWADHRGLLRGISGSRPLAESELKRLRPLLDCFWQTPRIAKVKDEWVIPDGDNTIFEGAQDGRYSAIDDRHEPLWERIVALLYDLVGNDPKGRHRLAAAVYVEGLLLEVDHGEIAGVDPVPALKIGDRKVVASGRVDVLVDDVVVRSVELKEGKFAISLGDLPPGSSLQFVGEAHRGLRLNGLDIGKGALPLDYGMNRLEVELPLTAESCPRPEHPH